MARHYPTNDFFQQMPNALLAAYFQERGLFGDLDFSDRKKVNWECYLRCGWTCLMVRTTR